MFIKKKTVGGRFENFKAKHLDLKMIENLKVDINR